MARDPRQILARAELNLPREHVRPSTKRNPVAAWVPPAAPSSPAPDGAVSYLRVKADLHQQLLSELDRRNLINAGEEQLAEVVQDFVDQALAGQYLALNDGEQAPGIFVAATISGTILGLVIAASFVLSGLQELMEQTIVQVPGGVGETFLPVVWIAPWLFFLVCACAPWLIVRQARRQRSELIEQDLPLALELLSTLSEAGLGFDAALTRILKTRLAGRPLAADCQMFQADLLAGRTRVESLRRLASRVDLPSVSIFVSAMVQAEQLGMGIARVLRQQADDMRARRRERALAFANALPTKRVIPLVVCFLPGLFVWTLGPAFVQLFKLAETFIQVRNF